MKNEFVLVEVLNDETKTDAGIILLEEKYPREARVIMCREDDEDLDNGDLVLKNVGRGTPIILEGKEYEILHKDFILAILEKVNE